MDPEQLQATFDRQAATYDEKWSRLAAFRDALHLLIAEAFAELPADARVLCVGAGTGAEIVYLARRFPRWTFTAVEPSAGMLAALRRRAEEAGIADRCVCHEGYLDTLPPTTPFDAATCLLVSQFILEGPARVRFFGAIARRLRPAGLLASSDLSGDVASPRHASLLDIWLRTIGGADATAEAVEQMRAAYRHDVAVLPARAIEALLLASGFESPVQFFQAGLIHAWYCRRAAREGR